MCPNIRQECDPNLDVWARSSYYGQLRLSSRRQLEGTFLRVRTTISVSGILLAATTDEEVEACWMRLSSNSLSKRKRKKIFSHFL
jgi:hypothetical protein